MLISDEPVFGSYLDKVCPSESPRIPLFVQQCINCIEITDENMKTDGLYRASGNLSQVQKIRLQVCFIFNIFKLVSTMRSNVDHQVWTNYSTL